MYTFIAGDGVYADVDNTRSMVILVDLKTNTSRDLVSLLDVKNVSLYNFTWISTSYVIGGRIYIKHCRVESFSRSETYLGQGRL